MSLTLLLIGASLIGIGVGIVVGKLQHARYGLGSIINAIIGVVGSVISALLGLFLFDILMPQQPNGFFVLATSLVGSIILMIIVNLLRARQYHTLS